MQVLDGLVENAEQLAESVHSTSEISERVSYKVRELNTAQSRIDSTLRRINIVVERSGAVEGIRSALEAGDFESAAEHVRRYLDLEQRFGKVADEIDSRQLQEQQKVPIPLLSCFLSEIHAGFYDRLSCNGIANDDRCWRMQRLSCGMRS